MRHVPKAVIEENKNIVKVQSYRVDDDSVHRRTCSWVSLVEEVKLMQESVHICGGHKIEDYKKFMQSIDFSGIPRYNTLFCSVNENCVDVTIKLINQTQETPLLLNLAQRWIEHICGAWWNSWSGSQEEAIERRSAVYRLGLDPALNPKFKQLLLESNNGILPEFHIPEFGAVYHKGIPIIRDRNWRFYDEPCCIDVIAVGGIDLRWLQAFRHGERAKYVDNPYPIIGKSELKVDLFKKHTKYKLRIICASAVILGYKDLILGALGCGAFGNPTDVVAACWKEVFEEERFKGAFRNVIFSVMGDESFIPFSHVFPPLNDYSELRTEGPTQTDKLTEKEKEL